jgi:hypothetical protein
MDFGDYQAAAMRTASKTQVKETALACTDPQRSINRVA